MICDFCSASLVRYTYTSTKIMALVPEFPIGMGYDNKWAACETCAEIINRKDMEGLVKRAIETFVIPMQGMISAEERPAMIAFAEENMRNLYRVFFANLKDMRRMCLEEAERPPPPIRFESIPMSRFGP